MDRSLYYNVPEYHYSHYFLMFTHLTLNRAAYMTSQATNRREGGSMSCRGRSRKLRTHLERAKDCEDSSRTAWCADYWQGECPARGWWWRDSQKSNKPSKPPEMHKNIFKNGGFTHFLAYKSLKTPFFTQKYLTRYNFEMFFEEYMNFKLFLYLGHCEAIPLQRFGSHICPQPLRLGLSTLSSGLL